jgi:hypothetical protein
MTEREKPVIDRVVEVVVQIGAIVFVVFLGWVFKRAAIDKRPFSSSTSALATVVFESMQSQHGRAAIEEMMFTRESRTEAGKAGDDPLGKPGPGAVGPVEEQHDLAAPSE